MNEGDSFNPPCTMDENCIPFVGGKLFFLTRIHFMSVKFHALYIYNRYCRYFHNEFIIK